jgi:hypothetical protein
MEHADHWRSQFYKLGSRGFTLLFVVLGLLLLSTIPAPAGLVYSIRGIACVVLAWCWVVIVRSLRAFIKYARAYRVEHPRERRNPDGQRTY